MIVPIITCMGRLHHLRQTLPRVVREFGGATLVDWSCPQGSGRWARGAFGTAVDVVSVPRQRHFHKTRALNAGARAAGQRHADWLLFLDADTVIGGGLAAACARAARPGQFAVGDRIWPGPYSIHALTGVLLVSRGDFERVGAYDEAFRDYGLEDTEMRCRLRLVGRLRTADLPPNLLAPLHHDDTLRSRFYSESRLHVSIPRNLGLFRQRVRSWTGRELEEVREVHDLLYREPPRRLRVAAQRLLATLPEPAAGPPPAPPLPRPGVRPSSWRAVSGKLLPRTVPHDGPRGLPELVANLVERRRRPTPRTPAPSSSR